MAACDEVRPALDRYMDGETDREGREAVEKHLAGCAGCRAALSERRGASALLKEWGRQPARAVLTATGRGPLVAVRVMLAAAAALLVAGLCLAQYNRSSSAAGARSGAPLLASAGHQVNLRALSDGGVQVVPGKAGEPAELVVEAFPLKWRSLSSGVQVIPGKSGEAAELVVDPFPEEGK